MKQIVIDGVTYIPESSKPVGNRAVVVVDRGWILIQIVRLFWWFWASFGRPSGFLRGNGIGGVVGTR